MLNSSKDKLQKAIAKKIEREIKKRADPKYKEHMQKKKLLAAEKAMAKKRAKLLDPEYIKKQREKSLAKINKKSNLFSVEKTRKPIKSKGMVGRTPSAEEKSIINKISSLPCIACYQHGVITDVVSYHHIDGRTKKEAHKKGLPLCGNHHQIAAPAKEREKYPWLVPVHASGSVGGKASFEKENGTQEHLLNQVYEMINRPDLIKCSQ